MTDFTALLNKSADTVERPKPAPAGTYTALLGEHSFDKSAKKGTPFVRYKVRLVSPHDDVDAAALEDFGGMEKLAAKEMKLDFYLTDDALFRLTEELFVNTLGMNITGRTVAELIPEAEGQEFLVTIGHQMSQDGSTVYANIDSYSKVS